MFKGCFFWVGLSRGMFWGGLFTCESIDEGPLKAHTPYLLALVDPELVSHGTGAPFAATNILSTHTHVMH